MIGVPRAALVRLGGDDPGDLAEQRREVRRVLLAALALVHTSQFFTANPKSGGYALELQFMYLFGALSLLASGMGRFVIGGSKLN